MFSKLRNSKYDSSSYDENFVVGNYYVCGWVLTLGVKGRFSKYYLNFKIVSDYLSIGILSVA